MKAIKNHHGKNVSGFPQKRNNNGCEQATQQQSLNPTTACGLPTHGPTHQRTAKAVGFALDSALPEVAHVGQGWDFGKPDNKAKKTVGKNALRI